MSLRDMKRALERAVERKAKSACMTAIVIANHKELSALTLPEVCEALGVSDTYKHTIRAALQIPEELEALGFTITKHKLQAN